METTRNYDADAAKVRCPGTGTVARNVSRDIVGRRMPVRGQCQTCLGRAEVTRDWNIKYHRVDARILAAV